jgi:hypothetical protein
MHTSTRKAVGALRIAPMPVIRVPFKGVSYLPEIRINSQINPKALPWTQEGAEFLRTNTCLCMRPFWARRQRNKALYLQ